MAKKVLIITYYWPPSGGGGVQRWLKFAKYLPELGWDPVIFTPENPDFEIKDESLTKDVSENLEVVKLPILEPFSIYRKLMGNKAEQKQGVVKKEGGSPMQKLVTWVRGNVFIPDARMFWIKPATKYLVKYLKENPVDVIISTGPPHSMHMIAGAVKRQTGIPWLADFRDPWSEWDVLPQLSLNERSWKKHKQLEFEVLNGADRVVTVSKRLGVALDKLTGVPGVRVINNGFDGDDFDETAPVEVDKFRIVHMGLLNEGRNPKHLWEVLNERCLQDEQFRQSLEVVLAGTIEQAVKDDIASYTALSAQVKILDYVAHEEALGIYKQSAVLLLLVNNTSNASWILPGKMYEYFSAQKPILALGNKNSDANDMLEDCGYKSFMSYTDARGIKDAVDELYDLYRKDNLSVSTEKINRYTRKNLTGQLSVILDELVLQ